MGFWVIIRPCRVETTKGFKPVPAPRGVSTGDRLESFFYAYAPIRGHNPALWKVQSTNQDKQRPRSARVSSRGLNWKWPQVVLGMADKREIATPRYIAGEVYLRQ